MSKITIVECQLSDLDIVIERYPGAVYWDESIPTINDIPVTPDSVLRAISELPGTFILNGLIEASGVSKPLALGLINLYRMGHPESHIILISPGVPVSSELYPFVSVEKIHLPNVAQIEQLLAKHGIEDSSLTKAFLGLTCGEINMLLAREYDDPDRILKYKLGKLEALGFKLLPKPDVEVAGLDNLNRLLDNAAKLLEPDASKSGLKFPKGVLMWGVPGGGKTLAAKHAASRMGIPLIALDWSMLLSPEPGRSEANLRYILEVAETISPCVVYADDFDKAFSSSDLSNESSTEKRIAGMLLTWLQDCDQPVYFMASVNRAEQLPPELLRRFTDIVFVDYPHQGQAKEIFDLHLAKYTDSFEATRIEWQQILRQYQYCTPAEIGRAVTKAAEQAYFEGRARQITPQDIINQRSQFVSGYTRDRAAILRIQKNAALAIPATSEDNSVWRVEPSPMFKDYLGEK